MMRLWSEGDDWRVRETRRRRGRSAAVELGPNLPEIKQQRRLFPVPDQQARRTGGAGGGGRWRGTHNNKGV